MATPVFQQQTIAEPSADWSGSVPFEQFDPASGILVDAVFTTVGTVSAFAWIENLSPAAATVNIGVTATIIATAPVIGTVASLTPTASASVTLAGLPGAFDGTLDFTGPSGTILPDFMGSQTQTDTVLAGPVGSLPFVGGGAFDVAVSSYATSTIHGNGNLAVLSRGTTGVQLSLQYDSAPPPPDGGSYAAGVMALGGYYPGGWIAYPGDIGNRVTTTPQVVTLASETSGWIGMAAVNQFNPALGTLDEIIVTVGDTIAGTFLAENLEDLPASVSMNETASMTVATPGDASGVTATASSGDFLNLGAFDNGWDFAGSSGRADTIVNSRSPAFDQTGSISLADGIDLAAFTGTGTIALPVGSAGTSTVTGPSDLLTEITQQTGGNVSVSYVYTPAAEPAVLAGHWSSEDSGLPLDVASGPLPWQAPAVVPTLTSDTPGPRFIGGLLGGTHFTAHANDTFVIEPVPTETISNFSLGAGDRLDLSAVLGDAALARDLSNLGSFLSVTDHSANAIGGVNTTLAVSGPKGVTTLVLGSSGPIDLPNLLDYQALVLPPR